MGCQIGRTTEGAVNVALEVCVVEEFERVTTPADYLAAAGEVETFEWVKEGHKRVPVEKRCYPRCQGVLGNLESHNCM